jgi:ATP-binding cassette, subfamily B, bacterial PglK
MIKIVFNSLKKIIDNQKNLVLIILALSFLGATIQTLNILLVGPLALTFFNPELILQTKLIDYINEYNLQISENNIFVIICLAFLITFIFSNLISLLKNTIQIYLTQRIKIFSSTDLLNKFFKSNLNSIRSLKKSEIDKMINTVTEKFSSFSSSIFNLIEAIIYILFISIIIIFVNKFVIVGLLLVILLFLFFYFIFDNLNKKFYSEELEIKKKLFILNTNFLHGYLDIILNKLSKKFLPVYKHLNFKLSSQKIKKNFIQTIPKNLIQIFMYSILIYLLIYSNFQLNKGSFVFDLSIIGFATIRLVPYISSAYIEITTIKQNLNVYKNLESFKFDKGHKITKIKNKIVNFKNRFELKAKYWFNENKIFDYNIKVNKGDKVLITGPSGSGKSTLMNILSGIILPKQISKFIIDGKKVEQNTVLDIDFISYLDQNGLIYEGTILQNITNFQKNNTIDINKLKKIYYLVGLNSFINSFDDLSKIKLDFDPKNLSGGQRQRILLAKCFYKNANLYILDESMNQLDKKSEIQIIKKIFKFLNKKTFLVISHRPQNKYFNKTVNLK